MPATFAPHSVNLSVSDLDSSIAWYRDVFGFQEFYRNSYPEMQLEIAFLKQGEFEIELIKFGGSVAGTQCPDAPRHTAVRGITHVALRVPSLEKAISDLAAHGVKPVWGIKVFPELKMSVVFFRDPDGNQLKLVEKQE